MKTEGSCGSRTENNGGPTGAYEQLKPYLEQAMAIQTALILFEWDNETLAPDQAGPYTARVQGNLASIYQEILTGKTVGDLLGKSQREQGLSEIEQAIIREAQEEREKLACIPPDEYQKFHELAADSARIWAKAKQDQDFEAFAPILEKIISYQKKFAGYQAKDGQKLYDVMLDNYEKGFSMEKLDEFFQMLKKELVPLVRRIRESGTKIRDSFLYGDYPEEKQQELAEYLAGYVGFDFNRGVLAKSAHPFTTSLHNHDVRITTNYKERMDSSLFSVIHEAGHAVYELGIADELTQTLAGQGASMGIHESQSRFFENMIGRNGAFWVPVYPRLKELFPEQLSGIDRETFVRAINKIQPGPIRTEADELTYSLHVMVRYELEKMMIEDDFNVKDLPRLWTDKYEEYLGVKPENVAEGVLQDIHWAQGSFGYFPSYALGSAFAAQMYRYIRKKVDFDELLRQGNIGEIREILRQHIHRFGKLKDSRRLLQDMTGEDFNPRYYIEYLQEKAEKIYFSPS